MRGRLWQIWTFMCIGCGVLFVRLFGLTLWHPAVTAADSPAGGLRTAAARENMHVVEVNDGRGRILYRNGAVWRPAARHAFDANVVGVVGLPDKWPDAGRHVPLQGRSGLEFRFDSELKQGHPSFLSQLSHSRDSMIYAHSGRPGVDVRTTVDAAMERIASSALTEAHVKRGALAMLDVHSNDVLAMTSLGGGTFHNLAVMPQTAGSIFKLVTAAAALDAMQVVPGTTFHCDGAFHHPGVRMQCWRTHGEITLVDAIAQSCDVALGEVGLAMGRKGLSTMADRLHLTSTGLQVVNGRSVLTEAMPGQVFARPGTDAGLIVNTAIGQEDVRLSPLQGAILASTIANAGVVRDARLVQDFERAGRTIESLATNAPARAMSPYAARVIGAGMDGAAHTAQGTAVWLQHEQPDVAVKTGTAELPDGRVNGWLIGYWPIERPQIAFSIFVGDAPAAEAHKQVRAASEALLAGYRQFHATPVIG